MLGEALAPLSFESGNPVGATAYLQDPAIRLAIDFFQAKGLAALKREDREESWHQDWVDYQSAHGLYASLLSPKCHSNRGNEFSLLKLTRFAEIMGYFSPAHGYSLQVSFLGLFPILLCSNDALKAEAIAKLEAGGLFAFGVSEQAHGSDLFSNEFTVTVGPEGLVAHGSKYYIGNANVACVVTILGKKVAGGASKRAPFIFFAIRPAEAPAYQNVCKIRTLGVRSAYVGAFEVKDHDLPEGDIIAEGRDAWEAVHATVNFGKFWLGFGAIGIAEHAFAEAIAHVRDRILYGKSVLQLSHIRNAVVMAFARLAAMKLYAYRALDYLQSSHNDDRRFLLFHAVQKARVSTEGVKVIEVLSECIGARGFESETFFESALREAPMIPSLEGSTHINFGLTAQFIENYFAEATNQPSPPGSLALGQADAGENPYWTQAHDRNAKTVHFAPYLAAYKPLRSSSNVRLFVKQVQAFRRFATREGTPLSSSDHNRIIAAGRCLAIIAYAQLVAENCVIAKIEPATVSLIFHALVEDLSTEAMRLMVMFPRGHSRRALLKGAVRVPSESEADIEAVAAILSTRYAP